MSIERRIASTAGTKPQLVTNRFSVAKDSLGLVSGYGVVFYSKNRPGSTYDLDWFEERIAAGAFKQVLKERQDVRALFNHDASQLLGRLPAGTLRLKEDSFGLKYEIDLLDTTDGRDLALNLQAGNVTGSSFSFTVADERWSYEGGRDVRTIVQIDRLFDVGPVTFPAYTATTAAWSEVDESKARQRRRNQSLARLGRFLI